MEGRGVTNYDATKPNFNITTTTTEFDDELMKRNIVSFEQCMIAKGASPEEARRLALLKRTSENVSNTQVVTPTLEDKSGSIDEESSASDDSVLFDSEDEEDEFLAKYRSMRLEQIKQQQFQSSPFGTVKKIQRSEWTEEVNDSSRETLKINFEDKSNRAHHNCSRFKSVIVFLSPNPEPDPYPELQVEKNIEILAKRYSFLKFVKIDYKEAIHNWPITNLPTIFVYQGGEATHQLIGVKNFLGKSLNDTGAAQCNSDRIVLRTLEKKLIEWDIVPDK